MRGPGQTTIWGVHSEQRQVGHTPELAQTPVPMGCIPHLALPTSDARDADRQARYTTRTVPTSDRSIHPRAGGEVGQPLGCDPAISSHLLIAGLPCSCEAEVLPPLEEGWKGAGSSMRWTRQFVNDAEFSCDACMHDPRTESLVTTTATHHRGKGHEDF
jgi:hypothetical protein